MLSAALTDALLFMGLKAAPGLEIRVGGKDPGPVAAWLKPAPLEGEAPAEAALADRGFSPEHFRFLCLKTHYRRPLAFSWEALAAARAEYSELRTFAQALSEVALDPSPHGRVGYLHRFREALSKDLDLPAAVGCVWDGLRPGALSPGSRAALVRETFPALGLA
jgi:cysteinyl-tRNA synthetase